MLIPPPAFDGWKVTTIGDDIAWIKPGARRAAATRSIPRPATSASRRAPTRRPTRTAWPASTRDVIFTNVALTDDGDVWWEGMTDDAAGAPDRLAGPGLDAGRSRKETGAKAAHPNARFTVAATNNPALDAGLGQPRAACRSTPSSSAAGARRRCRSSPRRATGPRASTWPRRWARETTAAAAGAAGRGAARPVRDAAVHRLQHERLLPALARHGRGRCARSGATAAEDLLRQLVPEGRRRQVRLARLRREHARAEVDRRPRRRPRRRREQRLRHDARATRTSNWSGLDFSPAQFEQVRASTPRPGAPSSRCTTSCSSQLAHHLPAELPEVRRRIAARLAG